MVDGGAIVAANSYVAYKYFFILPSLLALNFEKYEFRGSSSDSTNAANSSEAEEEELYITATKTKFNSTIESKISQKKNYDI